jgi:hypothetical protein
LIVNFGLTLEVCICLPLRSTWLPQVVHQFQVYYCRS